MLINKISIFHSLGFPILIGTSRKRFIENIVSNFDTKERLGGTLSSVLFLYSQGIKFFRAPIFLISCSSETACITDPAPRNNKALKKA